MIEKNNFDVVNRSQRIRVIGEEKNWLKMDVDLDVDVRLSARMNSEY